MDAWVFFISYPGYPDNKKGKLLHSNPVVLVDEFIEFLKDIGWQGKKMSQVLVIGSSFGGSIALNLKNADRIVAVSPIVDFRKLYSESDPENYNTLKNFLLLNHYRLSKQGWEKFVTGKMLKLNIKNTALIKKSLIVYNRYDSVIKPKLLKSFIKRANVSFLVFNKQSHLSLRKISNKLLKRVLEEGLLKNKTELISEIVFRKLLSIINKYIDDNYNIAFLIYGSLSAKNLVRDSDIDMMVITSKLDYSHLLQFPKTIDGHRVEQRKFYWNEFVKYVSSTPRGLSKLIGSTVFTNDKHLENKIVSLRNSLMRKYQNDFPHRKIKNYTRS